MILTAEFAGIASAQLIDVSNFQGAYDWVAAQRQVPGLAGGICKLTEGTGFTDADAAHNWAALAQAGLVRGGYHFAHPGEDVTTQLDHFLGEAGQLGLRTTDLLALDLEVTDSRSPAQVAGWAQAFMAALTHARPHNPVLVYTMTSFATGGESAGLGKYPLWLARPGGGAAPVAPPPWAKWTFWQWGTRSGVDADAFNGTAADLAAWVDSFQPVPSPPPVASDKVWTADGHTSVRQFAHRNGVSVLDVAVATIMHRAGKLGTGEQSLLSGLLNGNISPDQVVPAGTQLWAA
jgi:GH25 family lysozyme M1 (1,4-beta-N-acetylmuramidase)